MPSASNRREETDRLESLSAAIRDLSDPSRLMRRVLEQALVLVPAAEGAVIELADGGHLSYVCAGGTLADHVGLRVRLDESLSGLAVQTGETLYCEDCAADPRVDRDACRKIGTVSMVCVPLRRGGQPIGALKVSAGRPRAFATEHVAVLARLADFMGAAIGAVADIARTAAELVSTDPPREHEANGREAADRGPVRDSVSEFVANVLQPAIVPSLEIKHRIEQVLAKRSMTIVFQPIVDLDTGKLLGAEALARFPRPPEHPPDIWFAQAEQVHLGVQLQLLAVHTALKRLDQLPSPAFLAINIGPDALLAPELTALLENTNPTRIVFELTEHLRIDDYPHLRGVLKQTRAGGIRLAIDDTGAGFASLSHIVNLAPDLIKLDRHFTRGIDLDPVRRALATALVSFAHDTGAEVIAEGIETEDELIAIHQLGIPYGQGYFISRPQPARAIPSHFPLTAASAVRKS